MLRHGTHQFAERVALAVGYCSAVPEFEWSNATRLVFVCTGNICRSPFAEALARKRGLCAASCGTNTRDDLPADSMAVAEAARRDVDLSGHRTTRWDSFDLRPSDFVIATQLMHAAAIRKKVLAAGGSIFIMSALLPGWQVVHDPYGLENRAYVRAFDQISEVVDRIVELRHGVDGK